MRCKLHQDKQIIIIIYTKVQGAVQLYLNQVWTMLCAKILPQKVV